MLLFLFVLLVAAANLSLGFAAAMYLGVGPQTWPPQLNLRRQPTTTPDSIPEETPVSDSSAQVATTEPEPTETSDEEAAVGDRTTTEVVPAALASVLERLARGFDHFEAELASWDNRRRDVSADVESDDIANSAIELAGLMGGYIEQLNRAREALASIELEHPTANFARDEASNPIEQLATRLCAAHAELQQAAATEGAILSEQTLTTALMQVLSQLHETRNLCEEPLVSLLGDDAHDPAIVPTLKQHADISLLGRLCFEHLWHESEMTRMSGQAGAVALLDIDNLRQINAKYGPHFARQALLSIGRLASEISGEEAIVTRLLGKQFALSLPHQAPQSAAETIERIRQHIEHTCWRSNSSELTLTVSAAVVAATMEDSSSSLLDRLRATVREAKSYGRNRTFLWEDQAPTPVVPLSLSIEPRVIEV